MEALGQQRAPDAGCSCHVEACGQEGQLAWGAATPTLPKMDSFRGHRLPLM